MTSLKPLIRPATEVDLPAILSLLLTSFRQFSLFSFLYSPLDTDKDVAFDTIWVWRRRLLLGLLDPSVAIIVAEIDDKVSPTLSRASGEGEEMVAESWKMLDWVKMRGALSQRSTTDKEKMVIGFAIWRVREGEKFERKDSAERKRSWVASLRTTIIKTEIWFWNKVWTRRDQDIAAYAAYLESEDELSEKHYADVCYYLDNACVDFRYQRLGIGSALVKWGIAIARDKSLAAMTESGPMGLRMYLKLGFQQIGTWKVPTKDSEQEFMEFPVLKLEVKGDEEPEG